MVQDNTEFNLRLPGIGPYEAVFGLQFYDALDKDSISRAGLSLMANGGASNASLPPRVIVPEELLGFPSHLTGKSVALVGNGLIKGCGSQIDSHDEVLRMDTLRNWRKSNLDDGARLTMWAGHPFKHFSENSNGDLIVTEVFTDISQSGVPIWLISPYHIPVAAYNWLCRFRGLEKIFVSPSQFVIMDSLFRTLEAAQVAYLFGMPLDKPKYIGLSRFELLLTGTKALLFLAMCGVKSISLYGFDLFRSEPDRLWDGHDVRTDLWLMEIVKTEIKKRGGTMIWEDEASVKERYL